MASPLLSPRGLFAPEHDYFQQSERPPEPPGAAVHANKKPAAAPDLSSLPRHSFPTDGGQLANLSGVTRASRLEVRPAAATVATEIAELDALTSGIPRGALTEIYGPASSGRTSVQMALLAEMTRRQEVCALVDVSDSFDPHSAAAAGVELERVLWVRCGSTQYPIPSTQPNTRSHALRSGRALESLGMADEMNDSVLGTRSSQLTTRQSLFHAVEQALKVTDLLLQSSGFGLIAVDLGDIPPQIARRIPLTSWFRFRRAVENTPTVLLVMEQEPYAKTCASLVLKMYAQSAAIGHDAGTAELPTHARLLRGLRIRAEVVRTRAERKPPRSVATFEAETVWKKATSY